MDFDKWAELQEQQEVFKPIEAKRKELWADFSSENLITTFPLTRAELEMYEIEKQLPENPDNQHQMYTLDTMEGRIIRIESFEAIVMHSGTMWELRTDTASIIRADQIRNPTHHRPLGYAMNGPCLEPGMMAELCPAFVASQPTMAVLIPYKMDAGDKIYENGFQYVWKLGDEPYYGTWGHSWLESGPVIPDMLVQQMNTPTEQRKDLFAEIGKREKYPVTIMQERCMSKSLNIPTQQYTMKRIYHDMLKWPRRENGELIDFNKIVDEDLAIMINDFMNHILEKAREAEIEEEAAKRAAIPFHNQEEVLLRHFPLNPYIGAVQDDEEEEYTHICPNCGQTVNEDNGYEYNDEWYCNVYCAAEQNDLEVCNTCGDLICYDDAIYFAGYEQYYCSRGCLERAIEGDDEYRVINRDIWRIVW